ncbi:cell wall-binding repeat-containing protein [Clostridium sp. Marseille-Q2269]|uniref:cell wall-binding repeat-containing protein n=1 Tax=Clostridium sp. Marseille-Q2269 TaxID=2942205 RepID=UPI002073D48A|nr:cell wall-binding repeat-containing protein [Clostridium sp. Marseille-Q2269]
MTTNVVRLAGNDRYDTCNKVANDIGKKDGFIVVNGNNFPDALSASTAASSLGVPILLTDRDKMPNYEVTNFPKNKIFIIGGSSVVSDKIKNQFNAIRVGGKDRYDTNLEVLRGF